LVKLGDEPSIDALAPYRPRLSIEGAGLSWIRPLIQNLMSPAWYDKTSTATALQTGRIEIDKRAAEQYFQRNEKSYSGGW